ARVGRQVERGADLGGALTHAAEPDAFVAGLRRLERAVVADAQRQGAVDGANGDADSAGAGVLDGVLHRLLGDAEQVERLRRRQRGPAFAAVAPGRYAGGYAGEAVGQAVGGDGDVAAVEEPVAVGGIAAELLGEGVERHRL